MGEAAERELAGPGLQSDRSRSGCLRRLAGRASIRCLAQRAAARVRYRLPSEAEWEYAARAGTTTRFFWGDDDADTDRNAWFKGNSGGRTHPVGSKPANAFGLYDMAGNVWQWTQDCYAETYASAPSDGSAAEPANSCMRVDRGGSWFYPPWMLRSATRERNPAAYRDIMMGFRVARTLP